MFIFSEMETNELDQVARLYNELARELQYTSNDLYFDFETLSDEIMQDNLEKAIQENSIKIYIAKHEGDIIGFISGSIINCFLPVSSVNKIGYIEAAFVAKTFRNHQIMQTLESLILEYFRTQGMNYVELNVLSANLTGKQFWEKCRYVTFREQMRKRL